MKAIDLTGKRFGRLVAQRAADVVGRKRKWSCMCDCGNEVAVFRENLSLGRTRSCGCLNREITVQRNYRHGMAKTRVYKIWAGMRKRCLNPKSTRWEWYGGRGITVCERWNSFENFYADMGEPPTRAHTIEREEVNGNYEPSNCIWLLSREQQKNRRPRTKRAA